ncbi:MULTISPECIES: carbohydrate ABC transporter permease [Burkholderia]|uniref:Binding-protein-dependent transport systems inner membrane component n=1 Tax=Burkholderia lata (strain ATCC 17760 / DSM 23089 / LMG 22485 / NCIMB 9086 / R18194 / 383) TaxID=482957 RepID=A0A6P2K5I5_BURL3|nr:MULTISPECIES: sugar ABC transporter permease [Burkholderia]RQR70556.1 sugar ABC transporter permease [Burkholderia sp. Bp9012]RQR77832.1 sugar ABC transporter permease [Burkholderia sp. Bp9011]RQR87829.1 sugar ABC transporter permease [Burkholderia sp. Bp9010]RQZ43769.1 sugar ABC transporter permease [Burkholderia sp. Bp9099]VWB49377.1 Binding-protein-dependent transport systems inner membrane component [Burkholderia lata]
MSLSLSDNVLPRGARRRPRTGASLARRRTRAALLFVLPGLALFSVFVLYPIVSSIWLSFHDWDGMTPPVFIGLGNYRELVQSDTFYVALKNNLAWLALFLAAPPLGLALALYLNQNVRGIRLVKSLFFAPFVLPGVVVGLVFSWFYDPTFGLLKLIVGHGIPVLGDPRYATYGVIAAALWPQIPFCMILYLTGLTGLNGEIVEAARMEGARGFTLLWHIILPQLRPATFMAIVLTVIGALRSFDLISVMTGGGPFDSSTVLAYFMYDQAIKYYREGYSAAIAVVLFAIMLVYIAWQLRKLVRTES